MIAPRGTDTESPSREARSSMNAAPTANGIVLRGGETEQDLEQRQLAEDLPPAGEEERARAVMEEGRIAGPQSRSDRRVPFVARGADGVEALPAAPEGSRGEVQVPAADLGLEQLDRAGPGETGAGAHRERPVARRSIAQPPDPLGEVAIVDGGAVDGRASAAVLPASHTILRPRSTTGTRPPRRAPATTRGSAWITRARIDLPLGR